MALLRDLRQYLMTRGYTRQTVPLSLALALVGSVLLWLEPALAVSINPGDLLVADPQALADQHGAVIRVDPLSGAQTLVSGGGSFVDPGGIAFGKNGWLLVTDSNALGGGGALFSVDPLTGTQTLIASGGYFVDPSQLAVARNGLVFIVDRNAFDGTGGVIRVNPNTGAQKQIASGGYFVDPVGIAIGPKGTLYVTDTGLGGIIQVNRRTGAQTVIASGFPDDGPYGVAVLPSGDLLVTTVHHDGDASTGARVIRVNPKTGEKSIIATGPPLFGPYDIALGLHGEIFAPDADAFALLGGIFQIDPLTGQQTTISSFGLLSEPASLAVAPVATPEPTTLLLWGTTMAGLGLAARWRRRKLN